MVKYKIFIKILIFLFCFFYFQKTSMSSAYQDMLFTTKDKIDRNNDKVGGYTFKFGGTIDDIRVWNRYKLGYPFSAIVIDKQDESKITQGRIQVDYIIINLVFGFFLILFLKLISKIFKLIKKFIDDSRIFDKNFR